MRCSNVYSKLLYIFYAFFSNIVFTRKDALCHAEHKESQAEES